MLRTFCVPMFVIITACGGAPGDAASTPTTASPSDGCAEARVDGVGNRAARIRSCGAATDGALAHRAVTAVVDGGEPFKLGRAHISEVDGSWLAEIVNVGQETACPTGYATVFDHRGHAIGRRVFDVIGSLGVDGAGAFQSSCLEPGQMGWLAGPLPRSLDDATEIRVTISDVVTATVMPALVELTGWRVEEDGRVSVTLRNRSDAPVTVHRMGDVLIASEDHAPVMRVAAELETHAHLQPGHEVVRRARLPDLDLDGRDLIFAFFAVP